MGLIAFLLRASRGVIVLSVLAGLAAGVAGVGLIALIQRELRANVRRRTRWPGAAFAGLCVAAAAARVAAQMAMVRLGQGAVAELGVHLVRRTPVAAAARPSRRSTRSAMLAALTEDIAILANALVGRAASLHQHPDRDRVPGLHRLALAADLRARGRLRRPGDRGRTWRCRRAGSAASAGRGRAGRGRRPLPHRDRRVPRAEAAPRPPRGVPRTSRWSPTSPRRAAETVRGLTHFAVADGWGQLAFFGFIGFLLFGLPQLAAGRRVRPWSRPCWWSST